MHSRFNVWFVIHPLFENHECSLWVEYCAKYVRTDPYPSLTEWAEKFLLTYFTFSGGKSYLSWLTFTLNPALCFRVDIYNKKNKKVLKCWQELKFQISLVIKNPRCLRQLRSLAPPHPSPPQVQLNQMPQI